jgi:cytoskeletal protein RodZ
MAMVKTYWKDLVLLLMAVTVVVLGYFLWQKNTASKVEQPQIATSEQAKTPEYYQQELKVPVAQSKEVVTYVEKAQTGTVQPAATFVVQAPTPAEAAIKIQQKIKDKDDSLPAAALEKTDRTVIAEQPDNPEQKVGVYKINLRKNHAIKVGAAYVDDKAYWTAGYRNRKLEYTIMGNGQGVKGGMVQYTVAEW